jgi:uncharacterized protein YkwD
MKILNCVFLFGIIFWFAVCMGCASYGAGGVYSSDNQSEMGVYIFGNSENVETTLSYNKNKSDNDTQTLGAGFSFKAPISFWKISLFPLANIEYQKILGGTETIRNLGWVRFGGGLDFSVTNAFYLRGEGMYAPDLFSFLPKIDFIGLNPATNYNIRLGLGWRPGAEKSEKRKEKPANTKREQPKQEKTNRPQTNQPQTNSGSNVNNRSVLDNANPDTARNVSYLSDLEKDIILEMNLVRSDPKKYAELYINPSLGAYAKECYEELRNAESRPVLFPKKGLSQAAKDHVANTGPKGIVGHDGADGSSMSSRINRYGTWGAGASENISYGYNTAREIVLQLLIDDGVESRGHRRNIMNKSSRYVGVAVGAHSIYRYMCVQDFAVEYTDR